MLTAVNDLLWGPGTLGLLLGTGIFLTVRMHFLPWRRLGCALRAALGREARQTGQGGVSPFSALMTTLAATIGTGNIAGVAAALAAGGPGALIWMELSALLGMATILTESLLSVQYRRTDRQGVRHGGPMYVMEAAFGVRFGRLLGRLFALFAVGASFGIGCMTQANAITGALTGAFSLPAEPVGILAAALTLVVIAGGIRGISRITTVLVPLMSLFYLAAGLWVIGGNLEHLLPGLRSMFRCAFSPQAIAGGAAGAALRWGIARGVLSNEAGLGSTGITAASADTADPVRQGYISMTGAVFDTLLLCTVTGLAICCSGVLGTLDAQGAPVDGAALTILAFETVLGPFASRILTFSIVLFAFSTILGWEYQGEQCFLYLTGGGGRLLYRLLYALAVLFGAVQRQDTVYLLCDICNALMCMPNLLCLLVMSGQAARSVRQYDAFFRRV